MTHFASQSHVGEALTREVIVFFEGDTRSHCCFVFCIFEENMT